MTVWGAFFEKIKITWSVSSGGLLACAIMFLDGKRELKAWSWIFIIEGTTTILISMSLRTPLCFLYMWLVY
jgi:hypothetical protein